MENIILITSNSKKIKILKKLSEKKLLYNIKFYTLDTLKKELFFDYNNDTIAYIIKNYHVNIDIAKVFLDNLYFLKNIPDEKIIFLNNLKKELEDNNLLIKNNAFKTYVRNKKIILYDLKYLLPEEELILKELDTNIIIKNEELEEYLPTVYEAQNTEEEVEFVIYKICELLNSNIDINKIKIIASKEYYTTLKRYAKIYNIPINIPSNNSFYSTFIAKEFLTNYDNYSLEDNIINLSEKYTNVNDLIKIINKSATVDYDIRKEFIIHDLKNTYLENPRFKKGVEVVSFYDNLEKDDYIFLLGFNINSYPKIVKDEEYLSDELKLKLGISTSTIKNRLLKSKIKEKITSFKNICLTYKLTSRTGVFYPSLLIKEMDLNVVKIDINRTVSYSKLMTNLEYAKTLDNLYKYNTISPLLSLYKNNLNIPYREYNNTFTNLNKELFKKSLDNNLTLSYTNIEMYNECSFKYYLSKILKIDKYEENFKTILGTITHHILELSLTCDINIPEEIIKFTKEKEIVLNKKEYFYLDKLSEELNEVIKIIKEQATHTKLNKYLFEEELYVYKDLDNFNITIKGLIDKVMYNEYFGKEVIAVVDYKTGNTKIDLNNISYGLDIQLPIYLYLLKKSTKFKDALIAGFYIQKVLDKVPNISNKTIKEVRVDNLKLQGFSNKDNRLLELLDDNYTESTVIKDLKYKKNGEFSSKAKILSTKEMEELTIKVEDIIDKTINNILNAEFKINPKIINNKDHACSYCKFKDICYKTKKDEVILGGEENDMD